MLIDLGPEHNWCDKRCERCPLTDDCALAKMSNEWRDKAIARGEDPDDPKVWSAELGRTLAQAIEMLEADAAEQGIDLDDIEPLPPPNQVQRLLDERAHAFVMRAHELLKHVDPDTALTTLTVGAKIARLAGSVTETWELDQIGTDGAATLVVIERLLAAIDEVVDARIPAGPRLTGYQRARAELLLALRPIDANAGDAVREAIADLTAIGRAPSPFCVVG